MAPHHMGERCIKWLFSLTGFPASEWTAEFEHNAGASSMQGGGDHSPCDSDGRTSSRRRWEKRG